MEYNEDAFDSSDIEIPVTHNPYSNLGKNGVQKLLDNHFEIRKSTKVAVKSMPFVQGAPGVIYSRNYWTNLFDVFYKEVLKKELVFSDLLSLTSSSELILFVLLPAFLVC